MNNDSIYNEIILSKTGLEIPVFKSGKTVDSRYDPQRESQRLLEQIKSNTHFVIVIGIASGIFIQTILQNRNDLFILAVERTNAELEYLKKLKIINQLSNEKQVLMCSLDELENKIIESYVPAFYGNLQIIEQRGWIAENSDCIENINKSISRATGIISADFSVQSHFGKLWQHNIINNIKKVEKSYYADKGIVFPTQKTTVILAAGPSVDSTINKIIQNREEYFIIATDTALSILISYKVEPDAVVSIDGQNISNVHFIHNKTLSFENTFFLFDLCANSSAVNTVLQNKGKIIFTISGHPLSTFINQKFDLGLTELFSGAGTVTINAVDFAYKAGFKKIEVAGADFAYSNGKPYAKGTYLDRLYNQKSNRLKNNQKDFCGLEFRTELIQKENGYTTQVLDAYRTSFEAYLNGNNLSYIKQDDLYKIEIQNNNQRIFINKQIQANGKQIILELEKIYSSKNQKHFNSIFELSQSDISLLPLISWLRNHDNIDKSDFNYFYEKALKACRNLGGN